MNYCLQLCVLSALLINNLLFTAEEKKIYVQTRHLSEEAAGWFESAGPRTDQKLEMKELVRAVEPLRDVKAAIRSCEQSLQALKKETSFLKKLILSKSKKEAIAERKVTLEHELTNQLEQATLILNKLEAMRTRSAVTSVEKFAYISYEETQSTIAKINELLFELHKLKE